MLQCQKLPGSEGVSTELDLLMNYKKKMTNKKASLMSLKKMLLRRRWRKTKNNLKKPLKRNQIEEKNLISKKEISQSKS